MRKVDELVSIIIFKNYLYNSWTPLCTLYTVQYEYNHEHSVKGASQYKISCTMYIEPGPVQFYVICFVLYRLPELSVSLP